MISAPNGHDIFVVVKTPQECVPGRVAFLAHGLNDVHDSVPMRSIAAAFFGEGYRVVLWDATNSRGRSGGSVEEVTITQYGQDLRTVLAWARDQPWFAVPYALAGHSLGGGAVGEYAASRPEEVSALVLVAPVVAGKYVMRRIHPALLLWWRWKGIAGPGRSKRERFRWEFMRNLSQFNLLPLARRLTMPVLFVVGTRDRITPPADAFRLYLRLPAGGRKFAIIWRARHWFEGPRDREDVTRRIREWLRSRGRDGGLTAGGAKAAPARPPEWP